MRATVLALALLAAVSTAARADEPPDPPIHAGNPQVTLPLAEYERIRRLEEQASVTVVDTLRLGGSFRSRNLTISFSGRSSGKRPPEEVLAAGEGVFVYGCTGQRDRLEERDGLHPDAARRELRGAVPPRGGWNRSARAEAAALRPVGRVPGGGRRARHRARGGRGACRVRRPADLSGPRDASRERDRAVPHHPEARRHALPVRDRGAEPESRPSDSGRDAEVRRARPSGGRRRALRGGAGRYRFELPPGDTRIVLTGTLSAPSFTPPVEGALQYALLDSHPLLLATLAGLAQEGESRGGRGSPPSSGARRLSFSERTRSSTGA